MMAKKKNSFQLAWQHLLLRTSSSDRRARSGVTTTEALISALVLGVVASMLSSFAMTTRRGLIDRELSARIDWEIVNLRERVGAWEPKSITEDAIEDLPVSKELSARFEESKFTAQIEEVDNPLSAKQVTLIFQCTYQGQEIRPAKLTFWVERKSQVESIDRTEVEGTEVDQGAESDSGELQEGPFDTTEDPENPDKGDSDE